MTIAYFDTVGGIAGDMTMAAFISAGVKFESLQSELGKLGIGGFELTARHVKRSAVDALHVDVVTTGTEHVHRTMSDIAAILDRSALSPLVKERSLAIFRVIAEAEARVHGTTADRVHFHEVGALDSIVDIVGCAICLEACGVEAVYSSPVRLGSGGFITTQHGKMPVPAPATVEILKGYPTVLTSVPHELTTPTGAAIIRALSSGLLDEERLRVSAVGYGAGTNEFAEIPNLLRVIIGTIGFAARAGGDTLRRDEYRRHEPAGLSVRYRASPGGGCARRVPRPHHHEEGEARHTALGDGRALAPGGGRGRALQGDVDDRPENPADGTPKLPRRHVDAVTSFGIVKAKAVTREGREIVTPEYEECRRIASERNMPLLDVMKILERELREGTAPA